MLSRILVPLLCLVAGLAIGFMAGQPSFTKSAMPEVKAETKPKAVALSTSSATPNAASTASRSTQQRQQQVLFDELVDDYSTKRAKRLADSLALDEMPAALAYLASKGSDIAARSMRMELMRAWARRDPQAAWQAALAAPANADRAALLGAVAGEMAGTQAEDALKLAMTLTKPGDRKTVIRSLFEGWAKVNPTAAIHYWNAHPDLPGDRDTASFMLSSIALRDPATATRLALTVAPSEYSDGLDYSLGKWIREDPSSARRWLDSITDPSQRDRALRSFARATAEQDPQTALTLAASIAASDTRKEAQRSIISKWLSSDPIAAANYIVTLNSDEQHRMAFWIALSMNEYTPRERDEFFSHLPVAALKTDIIGGIVRNATSRGNYVQAVEAVNMMPDSREREQSLHDLAVSWGKANPKALSAWLSQQADSSDRDLVLAGYSASLASLDPQAALKMAGTIPDTSVQKTAIQNVIARWMYADKAAAQAWLISSTLFSAQEKRIIESLSKSSVYMTTPKVGRPR